MGQYNLIAVSLERTNTLFIEMLFDCWPFADANALYMLTVPMCAVFLRWPEIP